MATAGAESMRGLAKGQGDVAPLDLAHLRRFTMGDEQLELEILGLFANQLPITIADLKNAQSEKEWGMAAHTLKGSARAVGAWSLATVAESAEQLKPLPDSPERGLMVRRIEEEAGVASRYIASLARVA
jgi:HPt (histidine-containing phosphotransfer) domain-containing protein